MRSAVDDAGMAVNTTWVALLRGINVGRNKRIAMADVRALLETLGYAGVRTHLNSGNAIFSTGEHDAARIERDISASIRQVTGMDVATLVRAASDLAGIVDANPFAARGANPSELHVTFTATSIPVDRLAALDPEESAPDEFAIGDRVIYMRLPNGLSGSVLPDWGRLLGLRTTTRNWNTTTRLRELAG